MPPTDLIARAKFSDLQVGNAHGRNNLLSFLALLIEIFYLLFVPMQSGGMEIIMEKLALLGGTPLMEKDVVSQDLFKWPIITKEDEDAALEVIRAGKFSGNDISIQFEKEFAEWIGVKHALTYCNGTQALAAAMFAIGLGAGDEIICTTKT